jgi:anti-sigma factor RsiW
LVPQRSQLRLRRVVAIAATLVVAVLSIAAGSYAGRSALPSEMDELLEEVSACHGVFARETDHLVEVPASRSSELSAWLGDRLGRKLNIPDLSSAGVCRRAHARR